MPSLRIRGDKFAPKLAILSLFVLVFVFFTRDAWTSDLTISDAVLNDLLTRIEYLYDQNSVPNPTSIHLEKEYLSKLDLAVAERMSFYVDDSYAQTQLRLEKLVASGAWTQIHKDSILTLLKQKRLAFIDSQKYYGTAKDFMRFNAFYEYTRQIRKVTRANINLQWSQKARTRLNQITRSLKVLRPFAKLAFNTIAPDGDDSHGTPLTKAADQYFSKISDVENITVKIEGPGKIEAPTEPYELNLILSNHVSAKNDAIVISHLNLDSYITFGALNLKGEGPFSIATHPLFKPVLKQIDKQRDLVLLGRGQDPLARLIEILKSGRTSNLFLFPQGMVSLGFDETNPLKPDFSEKVVQHLLEAGFKIRLYVMTMPDNFENPLSFKPKQQTSKELRVHLSQPIEDHELREILANWGPEVLDMRIRTQWIQKLRDYYPDHVGVLSEKNLRSITEINSCSEIF